LPYIRITSSPSPSKLQNFPAQLLSVPCSAKLKTEQRPALRQACGKD
jgi:hypothetical protein